MKHRTKTPVNNLISKKVEPFPGDTGETDEGTLAVKPEEGKAACPPLSPTGMGWSTCERLPGAWSRGGIGKHAIQRLGSREHPFFDDEIGAIYPRRHLQRQSQLIPVEARQTI